MCQTALSQADIRSGRVAAEARKVGLVELSERAFIAAYHQNVSLQMLSPYDRAALETVHVVI
jgi:hypothetical protein